MKLSSTLSHKPWLLLKIRMIDLSSLIKKIIRKTSKILPVQIKKRLTRYRFFNSIKEMPSRKQRVYLDKGLNPLLFFEKLDQLGVKYVLLRSWENLPEFPEKEDINILIADEERSLLDEFVSLNPTGFKCDIYTIRGGEGGSRNSIPVFPYNLSQALLENRIQMNGAWVPAMLPYFASVAYHALFHKGHNSGIPGFGMEPTRFVLDYKKQLEALAEKLNLNVEITVGGLYKWLKDQNYAPGEDTLTKLVEQRPELAMLQTRLFSDIRGGELMVFVVRERLYEEGFLPDFRMFLEQEYSFDILDVKELNKEQKLTCYNQIRGGKWDKGPYQFSGGAPVAFVIAFDSNPIPLSASAQLKQSRMTNSNNISAKYAYREHLQRQNLEKGDFNGLHSADNEQDALFYISLLGEEYIQEIFLKTEARREKLSSCLRMRSSKDIVVK